MGKKQQVGLLGTVEVLHAYLTGAMCEVVFAARRVTERRAPGFGGHEAGIRLGAR